MEKKALEYLQTPIGNYALTPLIDKKYPSPKHFLIYLSPEKTIEHKEELKPTKVKCTETKTGARFCIFQWDKKEAEGIEMCQPITEIIEKVKKGKPPSIKECKEKKKNAFLILKIKHK